MPEIRNPSFQKISRWPVGAWVISAYRQAMKQIWKCTVEDGQTGVALPRQDLSQSMGGTRFIRSNSYGVDSVNYSTWSSDCCDLSVTLASTKGFQRFGHWSWSDGWKWACQLYRLRPVRFQGVLIHIYTIHLTCNTQGISQKLEFSSWSFLCFSSYICYILGAEIGPIIDFVTEKGGESFFFFGGVLGYP